MTEHAQLIGLAGVRRELVGAGARAAQIVLGAGNARKCVGATKHADGEQRKCRSTQQPPNAFPYLISNNLQPGSPGEPVRV